MEVIPAIIGKDFNEIKEKFLMVEKLVKWVHLDVTDSLFTPSISWPYPSTDASPDDLNEIKMVKSDNLKIEAHLMVKNPERDLFKWIEAGVDRILIHYEAGSEESMAKMLKELEDYVEVEVGMVLKLETSIDVLDRYIDRLDVVQLMSIGQIGSYGLPFDDSIYKKIKSLRARYPGVTISVDGGVSLDNAKELMTSGADNLIVGSGIFKSGDVSEAIKSFNNIK